MLRYLDNKFNHASLKVKLELYILPLLLIYLSIYLYKGASSLKNTEHYNFNKLTNKKYLSSYLDLSQEIESFCNKEKIKLLSIKNFKDNLLIMGETSIKKLDTLLLEIEFLNNYTNLVNFHMNKKTSNLYSFEVTIKMNNFFVKDKEKYIKERVPTFSNNLNLKGIIDSYVFINKKWFIKNEIVNGYKIINIERNFVELSKNSKKITLWIYKDE